MELKNAREISNIIAKKAWELYENSFPIAEQRPLSEHIKALEDSAFHADVILDDKQFIGIIFYWIYNTDYCFVEHFAIDPALRSSGYGAKALTKLVSKGYITILEIDPPIDEISIRRQHFYERSGFILTPHHHVHPSYRPSTEAHKLKIMSHPRQISQSEFTAFRDYSMNHILKYVEK